MSNIFVNNEIEILCTKIVKILYLINFYLNNRVFVVSLLNFNFIVAHCVCNSLSQICPIVINFKFIIKLS